MLSPTLTNLLVEARVEELHRASCHHSRSPRGSATARQIEPSAAAALATRIRRAIARLFDRSRLADEEAAAIHAVVAHRPPAAWSRLS
ncbi:MAG: hypothetical protein JO262_16895 [Solirubrobacterales bacterium]|nr:hypothetical protein [Solirubrobacterales bacterium]